MRGAKFRLLPLRDSMQCLTLGVENPPDAGEYRVFNQFEEAYSIRDLADVVQQAALAVGLKADVGFGRESASG